MYYFFRVIPRCLDFMCRRFGTLYLTFVGPMKVEKTEVSETSSQNSDAGESTKRKTTTCTTRRWFEIKKWTNFLIWELFDRASSSGNNLKCQLDATRHFYWCILSSTCFGYIRPSSGALDVELQHMVFCTEFLDGWCSWEPHRTHDLRSGSQDHHPSKISVQKNICCNLTSNSPDGGRM